MKRVKWRAVWLVCWTVFLVADVFLDLRAKMTALVAGAEEAEPGLFYDRVQTALLVVFVLVALSPLLWPLVQRWFLKSAPPRATALERDPRDAGLAEALSYLAHRSAWGAAREASEDDLLREAAATVEDAARKGRIEIRGAAPKSGTREPLTADYWLSASIDLPATLDPAGTGGRTRARGGGEALQRVPVYEQLVVDRAALMRLWPADNVWRRTSRATTRGVRQGFRRKRPEKDKE
jgi:hypothetical protein